MSSSFLPFVRRHRPSALILVGSIAALLASQSAQAAPITWNQGAGGDFNTPGNWSPNMVPLSGDMAIFNIATGAVTLSADATPGSISYDAGATSFSLGTLGGNTITTANGGEISILSTLTAASQTFTINAPLILTPDSATTAGTFTIQNDGTSASTVLVIAGDISSGTTSSTETLTLAGTNTGANLISGNISNGGAAGLALVKSGAGTWTLSGTNSYTGGTSIAAGTLALSGGNDRLLSTGTLNFTGATGRLDVGSTSQTLGGLTFLNAGTTSNVITGAGGTLTVASGNVQIGGGDTTSAAQTVDMTGLGTFNYTNSGGTFTVGGMTNNANSSAVTGNGTLSLATTNTITAAGFNISSFTTGQNSLNSGTVHLGQTNTINASTILIGNQKTTGTLDFQNLVNPTLKIRGTAGTDSSRATITIGTNNSGLTAAVSTMDLTSGGTVVSTLDAMVDTLMIGQNLRSTNSSGQPSTGAFIMGLGTLDAIAITVGQQDSTAVVTTSAEATGTLSLNGGTITTTTLTLADKRSNAAAASQAIISNINLNSGTLNATTIQRGAAGTGAGADSATINFNWVDGTIGNVAGSNQTVSGNTAVNGLTGGLNIVLNNTGNVSGTHTWNVSGTQTSTLQSTVTLSGNGGLTKTGTGTLILAGANTYSGPTAITAGTARFAVEAALYNGVTSNWTAGNFLVNSGVTAIFNVGGAGEFTSSDIDTISHLGTPTGGFQSGSVLALDTTNAAGGSFTFSGTIANANNLTLTKLGTGTLVLTSANSHTGGTNIAAGTLALSGGNNRLPGTGTLNFTGATGTLDVGSTSQSVAGLTFLITGTNSNVITGAGGTLSVTGGNIQIGGGSPTFGGSNIVDMTGLSTFNYANSGGSFGVGGRADVGAGTSASGSLSMATTNTITAASFTVSPTASGQSSPNTGTVHLGQTNIINASTFVVGVGKATSTLDFQNLTNPTLKIRGTGGTDANRALMTIGSNDSGVVGNVATVDLTNGGTVESTLDAMISTLLIAENKRNGANGFASTATFKMGLGVLDATTIILGRQNAVTGVNTSGAVFATLDLNGGTISATTLTLAEKLSGAAPETITSTFNLNSGTLNATTIQRGTAGTGAGANSATINFNWVDGTIGNIAGANQTVSGNTALNGLTGGLNIVLNNTGNSSGTHTWNVSGSQTSTIQSTAILSGLGSLTKTGTGTLIFAGANTYTGMTTVSAGELDLNTTGGQALAGNLTVSGGVAKLLQGSQINSASNLVVSGGTFSLQGFNQTLANVQLTGGSITGSTGVLTSTNAYDLRAGSVSAILGGSAGVNKTTGGTVYLTGTNTYSGGTTVSNGILIARSNAALGSNSGLSVANGATFAYRPTAAGALNLGSGAVTLVGGSTIGTTIAGTAGQSAITSSGVASATGAVRVNVYGLTGVAAAAGTHNLLTAGSGLTSGGAVYTPAYYNLTDRSVSNFQATDTTISVTVASTTALLSAYWKGGLAAGNNVWALSDGTTSNWVTASNGTGPTALVPGSGATVTFSGTGATNQGSTVLGASMSIRNLIVADANPVTLNDDGNTLTLTNAAGIAVNSGAGAVTLNAPIIMGVAQSWTNNSSNELTIGGAVTNGGGTLTVTGSGKTTLSGGLSGSGGLTKSGSGTLTLSGPNAITGSVALNSGIVNLSGTLGSPSGLINIGSSSNKAMLNIQAGASLSGNNMGFSVGSGSNAVGAIHQTGGDILFNQNFNLGVGGSVGNGSYGFYHLSGGTVNDTGSSTVRFRMGGGASYSTGVFYQSGGSANIIFGNGLEVGANASPNISDATGVAYLTGGTFTAVSNRIGYNGVNNNVNGIRGEQTVAGSAAVTINGATVVGYAPDDIGILNLNGGVYATRQIIRSNGTAIVNFDGGTLKAAASASNSTFLTGLTTANVYAGGVTVDSDGQNVTIGQALLAPAGNGVTSITVTDGGTGYVGAPYISFTGGAGIGATAVANMVDDGTGNGTFKIASITVTSAGTGYSGTPTVAVSGGGGSGATFAPVATGANVSGGLTKSGNGTLTLSNTNTYTGPTAINQGTLIVSGSIAGSTVEVNSTGTLGGAGIVGAINVHSGGIVSPGVGIGTMTSGAVSLEGGGTFKLEINTTTNTSDLITSSGPLTLALTNNAILSITDLAAGASGVPLVFLTYNGSWNGGLFSYGGNVIADDASLTVGANSFTLDYNYNGNSVALVPEPGALVSLLGGIGTLLGLQRLRRRR